MVTRHSGQLQAARPFVPVKSMELEDSKTSSCESSCLVCQRMQLDASHLMSWSMQSQSAVYCPAICFPAMLDLGAMNENELRELLVVSPFLQ